MKRKSFIEMKVVGPLVLFAIFFINSQLLSIQGGFLQVQYVLKEDRDNLVDWLFLLPRKNVQIMTGLTQGYMYKICKSTLKHHKKKVIQHIFTIMKVSSQN